ncbi:hypothetical protein GH714_000974 [Hevea brasiliensis]|uniref:Subtilisin-like protease fibronectin type-III domain-containing protein n=1 Tax=Hevea brasiliensis TaxID=3981 RepID=A0A6A6M7C0_HEVBR|nr:hypothetical protein GH714_000974 [Hevea brasiliensis]
MNHNSKPHTNATHRDWYQSLTSTSDSILYTYNAAFHGFAAYLDPEEADFLGNIDAVLNVFESRMNSLKTTRTPEFLGIDSNFGLGDGRQFQEIEQAAHNVIIGVIDSGVWPESRSFDDTGLPEIPKRWKGNRRVACSECECVRPLCEGHRPGMAVCARVAIYKACGSKGCCDADTLAAMDRAILDGVDVISMSFGNDSVAIPYHEDTAALGAFNAMKRGIVVSCAGGDLGSVEKGLIVSKAGGVGMIIVNEIALEGIVCWTRFGADSGSSCRGPNPVTPQILKPDIIAPGVNILAAWPDAVSPSNLEIDKRTTKFNLLSGTSMACPHASGIAALIKEAHPSWSPRAIKSAMMTTAYNLDNTLSPIRDVATGKPASPWDYGSGHIDPTKALSPGLVYDISKEDYTKFLCSLHYPHDIIEVFMSHLKLNISCSNKFSDLGDLNYPSFSVLFKNKTSIQHSRELTNVGPVNSMYEVTVTAPSTVQVSVKPAKMVFKKVGEKQRYTVTFKNKKNKKAAVGAAFGWIVWSNAQYKVSSPVAFTWT